MRVLICPDTFKGTLSAKEASEAIAKGLHSVDPKIVAYKFPMADGGYGTLDVILEALRCKVIGIHVRGPLGKKIPSRYLLIDGKTAFIEMAQAAGLVLVPEKSRDPLLTTTFGVGELINDALRRGCTRIILGLGGSGTNDCGIGMAQALRARFYDKDRREVQFRKKEGYSGGSLAYVRSIDITMLNPLLRKAKFYIASDVNNPLCGKTGASCMYGPQKGASPETVRVLDSSIRRYAQILKRDLHADISIPGSGAAGGLGAGLIAFTGAEIRSGIETVMQLTKFRQKLKISDLVITGEGRIDRQTVHGKTISGIAKMASESRVPVIAISGCLGEGYAEVKKLGVLRIYDASDGKRYAMEYLKKHASFLLEEAAKKAITEHKTGVLSNET